MRLKITVWALLSSLLLENAFAVECKKETNVVKCQNLQTCRWINPNDRNGDYCRCNANIPLDIIFVLDASGSITPGNFELEKAWLTFIVGGNLSPDSRVGFIIYADNVNDTSACLDTPKTYLCYWPTGLTPRATAGHKDAPKALTEYVSRLVYTGGYTNTQDATRKVVNYFNLYGVASRQKYYILITDGQPYGPNGPEEVCQFENAVKSRGIITVVVGISYGWLSSNGADKVRCLVSNPRENMFYVRSFQSIAAINPAFLSNLCPDVGDVKITEVKCKRFTKNGKWYGNFVEIFNIGGNLPLDQLRLNGLIEGDHTTGLPLIGIHQHTYVVFYEYNWGVDCHKCEFCNLVKNTQNFGSGTRNITAAPLTQDYGHCLLDQRPQSIPPGQKASVYIRCKPQPCGPRSTWNDSAAGYQGCCFTGGDDCNMAWNQTIFHDPKKTGAGSEIEKVIYDRTNPDWVRIGNGGFTYELISKGYDNQLPNNWAESCYSWGTPGDDPVVNCPPRCNPDGSTCRQRGDMGATCITDITHPAYGTCVCTPNAGYYSFRVECRRIPQASECVGIWTKNESNPTQRYMAFKWQRAPASGTQYSLKWVGLNGEVTQTTGGTAWITTDIEEASNWGIVNTSCVSTIIRDQQNQTVTGDCIPCRLQLQPPSMNPTRTPTLYPTLPPTLSPTLPPRRYCWWFKCEVINQFDYCECEREAKDKDEFKVEKEINRRIHCCNSTTYPNRTNIFRPYFTTGRAKQNKSPNDKSKRCNHQLREWVASSDTTQIVRMQCTPREFAWDTHVTWKMRFLYTICYKGRCGRGNKKIDGQNNATSDENVNRFDVSPLDSITTPVNGTVIYQNETGGHSLTFAVKPQALSDGNGHYLSYFLLTMTDCWNVRKQPGDAECDVVYPNPVMFRVARSATCNGGACPVNVEKEAPAWIWALVGGGVLFAAILAVLLYVFWWKGIRADAKKEEMKEDVAIEIEQNEAGTLGDLNTGEIVMNPMATMNPNITLASDPVGNQQAQIKNKTPNQFAEVVDEPFCQRTEFGQTGNNAMYR